MEVNDIRQDFLHAMHSLNPSFSPTEKKIADYFSIMLDKVPGMTVTELAEACMVSEASIIRFSRKIGYAGYYQMKVEIIRSLTIGEKDRLNANGSGDFPSIQDRILDISVNNLRNTLNSIDMNGLARVVALLLEAKAIYFFAAGNSLNVAMDASYKLGKLGLKTFCEVVPERALMQARNMQMGDVAFGITHSGGSKLVALTLKIAHSKHIPVVCLTNFANSPIIKWCDHVILTSAHTAVLSEISILSRLCEHAVVDLLFHMLFQNKSESGQESFYLSEIDQSEYSF